MSNGLPDRDRLMVWLGNPYFHEALRRFRWRVIYRPCPPGTVQSWPDILSLTKGQSPDAVVAADFSGPPFLLGMENFPCLTVFYSVDTHIHSWHPAYAQGFDLCLVSLPDRVQSFYTGRLRPERIAWSPPYAPDDARPPEPLPEIPLRRPPPPVPVPTPNRMSPPPISTASPRYTAWTVRRRPRPRRSNSMTYHVISRPLSNCWVDSAAARRAARRSAIFSNTILTRNKTTSGSASRPVVTGSDPGMAAAMTAMMTRA